MIGIASLAALFRTSSLRKQWRYVHWLNYLAFLLATTHAILLGSEFRSTAMKVIPILLALALVAAFVLKRLQRGKDAIQTALREATETTGCPPERPIRTWIRSAEPAPASDRCRRGLSA